MCLRVLRGVWGWGLSLLDLWMGDEPGRRLRRRISDCLLAHLDLGATVCRIIKIQRRVCQSSLVGSDE